MTEDSSCIVSDQRNVGVEMKVERASVDSVKERLAMLKRKKEEPEEEYGMFHDLKELFI